MISMHLRATVLSAALIVSSPLIASDFAKNSSTKLVLRNYYFDRNYVNDTPQSAAREWALGVMLSFKSGFTHTSIGLGLDAVGMLGIKLDSSADRAGTGLLPFAANTRDPADAYSELSLTGKLKASRSELQVGTISTFLPIAFASPTRLLPQTFRGSYLRLQEIAGLTLHAGWLDRINLRDSTNYQKMNVAGPNGRFNSTFASDQFTFIGGDYAWSPTTTLKYYHAVLEELYRKHHFGLVNERAMGTGLLKSDLRLFISNKDGSGYAGKVDNRNTALILTYNLGSHTFATGYMHLEGDTAMPYLLGTEPLVITEGTLSSEFLNPNERSWQVKYDYDFTAAGLPGLRGGLRYVEGNNIELPHLGGNNLSERETDLELNYAFQSQTLNGLTLRLRHAWYRNNFDSAASNRDDNELRINLDYSRVIW